MLDWIGSVILVVYVRGDVDVCRCGLAGIVDASSEVVVAVVVAVVVVVVLTQSGTVVISDTIVHRRGTLYVS